MPNSVLMAGLPRLERKKRDLLASLEEWPADRIAYRPAPGQWCAAEVLDHMVKVESGILAAARQGAQAPHTIRIRDRVTTRMLELLFRSRSRVKAPASAPAILPDPMTEIAPILLRWSYTREELRGFCGGLSETQALGGLFRHPVAGWMDMPAVLRFFSVHLIHHGFQLERLWKASEARIVRGDA